MNKHSVLRHIAAPLAAASCAFVAPGLAAEPASADSIVYAKQGNLFLTSPDGSKGYQLTFDGGYSSPSQATNGTIGALRYGQLVRLNRSGQPLNAPINAMGSPGRASSASIGGPYEPKISPDGTRFAYYFYVQTSFDDLENAIRWIDTGSYSTWTYADHFTSPASESEYNRSVAQPEWLTNDRLVAATGPYLNMVTWKLGTGHGYTWQGGQWWFTLINPPDEWGVAAPHYYSDPAVSPDGSRLAMTDGGGDQSDMVLASTNGPAWVGEPPYPEVDYVNDQPLPAAPTIRCQTPTGTYLDPTWSHDGSMVAYGSGDGVHVMTVPADFDCARITDRLLVAGGSDPGFGPADVNLAQRPTSPPPPPQPGSHRPTAVTVRGLTISPHSFRATSRRPAIARSSGAVVRFTLNRTARVTLTVKSGRHVRGRRVVAGGAGLNLVPFTGWVGGRKLAAGRYQMSATAGASTARVSFQVKR